MNRVQAKRILKLVDLLRKVPPDKFDMSRFVGEIDNKWGATRILSKGKQIGECGTVACAAGWACTIPAFNKAGLYMRKIGPFMEPGIRGSRMGVGSALTKFFGKEASELFCLEVLCPAYIGSWSAATPKQIATLLVRTVRLVHPDLVA